MKKIIIAAILLIIAVGGFIAYTQFDKRTPDIVNDTPDVVITAAELIAAFDKDTASASKMYIDKVIEISGTVTSIDTTGSVVLGEEGSPSSVTVSLDRRHIKDHEQLKVGNKAVLQGRCSGYSKAGGDPDDLLASLGTTVELNFAGVKSKK